ncbi:hypothetical protein [Kitasatospora sp. NPDC057015]|uniref:hypothetical protein n=1 Tax=Kitasatospora sp. NPDC057015 TaxID=3346001 RepID=UPI00362EED88
MRDPMVWQAGDGPLAAWLEWVGERLAGPQPGGYTVRGDVRWPDQPYGVGIGHGLSPAALAELLLAEGVDGLYVRTTGGRLFAEPHLEIAPLAVPDLSPGGPGARILLAAPAGAPAGTVPLVARVRTPAELGDWLGRLSPLLPGPVSASDWPGSLLAEPLGVTFLRRRDEVLLVFQSLADAERGAVNPTSRLILSSAVPQLAGRVALLGSPAVLEERAVPTVRDLGRWLRELAAAWGGPALPEVGRWAGAAPLPAATRASVRRVEEDTAELMLRRRGGPEVWARGPASRIAAWAAPLLDPAVHAQVPSASRRRLDRWLERVGRAVLGGPAQWTVEGLADPLTTTDLARWLALHCPGRELAVDRVGEGAVTLNRTRTYDGWVTVSGHRGP